jgi:hypothetical protein
MDPTSRHDAERYVMMSHEDARRAAYHDDGQQIRADQRECWRVGQVVAVLKHERAMFLQ